MVCLLVLTGCTSAVNRPQTASTVPVAAATPSNRPVDWIGRWHAPDGRFLQIMPTAQPDAYQLTFGADDGTQTRLAGMASMDRLYFTRRGEALALRIGRGEETGLPALAGRAPCLIVAPGTEGYCRTPGTADALPLTPGAYAPVTADCWAPPAASMVYFDGQALEPAEAARCQTPLVDQQGVIFSLARRCGSAPDTPPAAMGQRRVTVADDQRFALDSATHDTRLYKYCPAAQLPASLRSPMQ
ncbi:hypothetical protein T31B1_06175 [Salinisphaera sp. T31B1]